MPQTPPVSSNPAKPEYGAEEKVCAWLNEIEKLDPNHPSFDPEMAMQKMFGSKIQPRPDEAFVLGTSKGGVTKLGVWWSDRRVPFPIITSVSLLQIDKETVRFDCNCTLNRRLSVMGLSVAQTDHLLIAISEFRQFPIVPTMEEQLRREASKEAESRAIVEGASDAARRAEMSARRQEFFLRQLVAIESAPRVYWGMVF